MPAPVCLFSIRRAAPGGTRLFRLAARPDAASAFDRRLLAGVLTRPFPDAPDRLRFGVPGTEADWARLAAALMA